MRLASVQCRKPSRQEQILIGYLPTSKLKGFPIKAGCQHALANVFHSCMGWILQPLQDAGVKGVFMRSGDGTV
jgi:Plavaka transposase